MALGDSVIFGMMREKMNWLGQRQRVLSQNIANADAPEFSARDLKPLSFTDTLSRQHTRVTLAVTHPQHLALPQDSNLFEEDDAKTVYETSVDGNSVVIEEQMIKLAETQADYTLATSVYRKYIALHRAALSRSQGS